MMSAKSFCEKLDLGKILRKTMKAIFEGKKYVTPATIDDPSVLEEIKATTIAS